MLEGAQVCFVKLKLIGSTRAYKVAVETKCPPKQSHPIQKLERDERMIEIEVPSNHLSRKAHGGLP